MNSLIFDDTGLSEQMGLFVRDGIDLDSPKKVKTAFQKLGIDIETTTEREIALVDHPAARELLVYRELAKVLSSFGDNLIQMIHPFTGRLHADFQQIGTRTGRFACRTPNLQQMPKEFRACVGLKGYKIVSADFANIELRILTKYSQDKEFIKAFNSGDDPHKSTAAGMFNIPIETVTPEQRFIAKTINFGLVYGMGVDKLRDLLNANSSKNFSLPEVRALHNRYKQTYSGAISWLRNAGEQGLAQLYSTTMLGRRRELVRPTYAGDDDTFNKQISAVKRKAANSPIQGTSADITKLAMLNVYHDLAKYKYNAKMIIQVHDEIVVLAHKSEAVSVGEVIVESMLDAGREVLQDVPIKVDLNINDVWHK
jgi:DNA polymerase I-like protein with 3'-5' exonuclease and polymerase domains